MQPPIFGPVGGGQVFILHGFAGQRAISFAFDPVLAPGMIAVVADVSADAYALRADLAALLGPSLALHPSDPEVVRPAQ
ncbi:MAG: hypothetical protein RIT14_1615 [Pseudomonadota bacterium]|jgi:hypothetical protein